MKNTHFKLVEGFPGGSVGKKSTCNGEDQGSILGWEDPLEKGKATHSSILAWRIPWTSLWGHKESDTTEHFHFTTQREKAAWQARKKPGLGT